MRNKKNAIHYYIMLMPGVIWLFMFSIIPMFGILIAFQDFNPGLGIFKSELIGLENFKYMFTLTDSKMIFLNTIIIAFMKIVANLFIPLVFALMLNEVRCSTFKRGIQTIVYLPHFMSWVILSGIIMDILGYKGPVNQIIGMLGGKPIAFLAKPEWFRPIIVISDVWKEFGFKAIIYLAALTNIDPTLYEAASIDGANKFEKLLNVTLPSLAPTIILLAALSLGQILNAGFFQIFNLYNPIVYSTGDIIDTWVYRAGLINLQFGLATAVGLLKSLVGFVMIILSYWIAYKFSNYRIF